MKIKLTDGERLLLDRRRRGETQAQAAVRYGVLRVRYAALEQDPAITRRGVRLGRLKAHERCLIYRRRAGVSQQEVAVGLGCCRWRVNQMEKGARGCDELLWYWEQ